MMMMMILMMMISLVYKNKIYLFAFSYVIVFFQPQISQINQEQNTKNYFSMFSL